MKRIFALALVLAILISALSACSVIESLLDRDTTRPSQGGTIKNPPSFESIIHHFFKRNNNANFGFTL